MIKNLITNKDIIAIKKKLKIGENISIEEVHILNEDAKPARKRLEKHVQEDCRRLFLSHFINEKDNQCFFQQNDNGGSKVSHAAQGTIPGWPDVTMWALGKSDKFMFVEFKRLGVSKIEGKQKIIHDKLKEAGHIVELCNNTVYFDRVICQRFRKLITLT